MKYINSLRFQLFAVLLILVALAGATAFQNVQSLNEVTNAVRSLEITSLQRSNAYLLSSLSRRMLSAESETDVQSLIQTISLTITNIEQIQDGLHTGDESLSVEAVTNPELLALLDTVDTEWENYITLVETFIASDMPTRTQLMPQIDNNSVVVFTFTDRFVSGIEEIIFQQTQFVTQISIGIGILLALILIASSIIIYRIVVAIARLGNAAQAYTKGKREARADIQSFDEIATVGYAFNTMADELNATIDGLEDRINRRTIDLKNARDEALAAQRMANENSRLKSEFLATMSHELRTPMNAIEGFTSIMLNGLGGAEFNAETEDFLQRIESNSRRLLDLINDFLDLSRIESGRLELIHVPFSPRELANRWRSEIGVLAEAKNLAFEVHVDSEIPDMIEGDSEAISKVAVNLLGNAIKFTEQGKVSLSLERQQTDWSITVKDTGIGIPPHARDFIFDEFRQVDQSSKRQHGGTGLGLAIVDKFVRTMGGSVTLDSEVEQGSTFIVTLPL